MSLTSFLEGNKDVRERFRQEFPRPKFSVKKDIVALPLSNRYSLVGTAFDYLLRFYLQRLNSNTIDKGYWVAESAVSLLAGDPQLYEKGQKIVSQAKERVARFLKTGQINDELMASTLLLGQLDPIFRAGVGHENIGLVYDEDMQDLRNLISIVEPSVFKAKELCLVNPTFGEASLMIGGADADLVIDDTIIDIKTTKKLELQGDKFHQLVGYYALHHIGRVGGITPKLEINKVAIYFSRYAYLHTFEVKDIVNQITFPSFIEWFEKRAREEFGIDKLLLRKK
jgi:hypothetical protein